MVSSLDARPAAPPVFSNLAFMASSLSSVSFLVFSLRRSSFCMAARSVIASRALDSAVNNASLSDANLSLMTVVWSPRPSAASRLSSGMV